MSTVLKFQWVASGTPTNVTFTDEEVYKMNIVTHQETFLTRLCNRAPILTFHGPEWREIQIDLIPEDGVAADVETLKDVTDIMTLIAYYQNGDVAENIPVRINPNLTLHYFAGYKDAVKLIRIVCCETSSGKIAVQFEHLPIGVA